MVRTKSTLQKVKRKTRTKTRTRKFAVGDFRMDANSQMIETRLNDAIDRIQRKRSKESEKEEFYVVELEVEDKNRSTPLPVKGRGKGKRNIPLISTKVVMGFTALNAILSGISSQISGYSNVNVPILPDSIVRVKGFQEYDRVRDGDVNKFVPFEMSEPVVLNRVKAQIQKINNRNSYNFPDPPNEMNPFNYDEKTFGGGY